MLRLRVLGLHSSSFFTYESIRCCSSSSIGRKNTAALIHRGNNVVEFPERLDLSHWNTVIRAFATSEDESKREAIWVFLEMRRRGVTPSEHTFPFLFKACASFLGLNEGQQIHSDVLKHGLYFNVYVQNTLILLYGSCKRILDAHKLFDEMPHRTIVSWNSIISANIDYSRFHDSFKLFVKMRSSLFEPDETTMVSMLSVCSKLGSLSLGKWIHSLAIQKNLFLNCQLGTALIDMYSKCGDVNYSSLVFYRMIYRNVWTWTAMILGYAQHGFALHALDLFNQMRRSELKPNDVTFLGVLCACSYAGLVKEGKKYFNEMVEVHGIRPGIAHFGAVVDILARSGRLEEAYDFIVKMPIEADGVMWRALLSACNLHDVNDYTGVGRKVKERIIGMEPKGCGCGSFVLLANNYAEVGLWEKAAHLRDGMRDRGLKKVAGKSCLDFRRSTWR